ncbi:MAG: T9SS type A sorting domain-containing protein [Saprospiraceae bacterium]
MKNIALAVVTAILIACTFFYFFHSFETKSQKIPKKDRWDLAALQEFNMTKDLATGDVPRERLLLAKREADRRRAILMRDAIPGMEWDERGPSNVGGRTRSIMWDPNDPAKKKIWAGSVGGGVWYNNDVTNPASTWTAVNSFWENQAVTALAFDPSNPNIFYAGTGEGYGNLDAIRGLGIWRTLDAGATWNQLPSTLAGGFRYVTDIVVYPDGVVAAATRSGLFKSVDQGLTWSNIRTGDWSDLELSADLTLYVAALKGGVVAKTTDQGANWTVITPGTGADRVELACAPSDANIIYAVANGGNGDSDVRYIKRSINAGNSWTNCTIPPQPSGDGHFTRGQAWYDLIASVSPTNPDMLIVGGVDLIRSMDGGQNWDPISHWYGGFNEPFVHADQHAIMFRPGFGQSAIFGNDGGVFHSANLNANEPSFTEVNSGYNVTQFYAADIAPEAGSNYMLAGAQDNGTQQYKSAGINKTADATGGDGAFCHIDQLNSQIQITSYVYNNYYVSTNGGTSFKSRSFGDTGRFINPTDYDDLRKKLYACQNNGNYLRWENPETGGNTRVPVAVSNFNNSTISAVKVSPNIPDRVYFGLENGDVVYVDQAHEGEEKDGVIMRDSLGGNVASIDIEIGNEQHVLITYSNYGGSSSYETRDGGANWISIEGDLPDMPVRWGIINPLNPDQAIIATELGVWTTNKMAAAGTKWEPSNSGLANVRTDMLKFRYSDNTIQAATHGRGVFTSTSLAKYQVNFQQTALAVDEGYDSETFVRCDAKGQTIGIPFSLSRRATESSSIKVKITGGSATAGLDYIFRDTVINLQVNGALEYSLPIIIIDDAIVENDETIEFTLETVSGNYQLGDHSNVVVTIRSEEKAPVFGAETTCILGKQALVQKSGPFGGMLRYSKTQLIYLAEELHAEGYRRGEIIKLGFQLIGSKSNLNYKNLSIKLSQTNLDEFQGIDYLTDLEEVFTGESKIVAGWNNFDLTKPFIWDGRSNIIVEICYSNSFGIMDDEIAASETRRNTMLNSRSNAAAQCDETQAKVSTSLRPNISFTLKNYNRVQQMIVENKEFWMQSGDFAVVYGSFGNLLGTVRQISGDPGCLKLEVDRAGNDIFYPFGNRRGLSQKSWYLNFDGEGRKFELTIFASDIELANWPEPKDLKIYQSQHRVKDGGSFGIYANSIDKNNPGLAGFQYRIEVDKPSGFALTDANETAPNAWSDPTFYPNPFHDYLSVGLPEGRIDRDHTVQIFDIAGKLVLSKYLPSGTNTYQLDLSPMANGVYIAVIRDQSSKKMIKTQKVLKL